MNTPKLSTLLGFLLIFCLPALAFAQQPPELTKSFSDTSIEVGETTTLKLFIDNSNSAIDVTDIEVTDNFPAGLQRATPDNFSNGCSGGSGRDTGFLSIFTFLSAGQSCTVTMDLVAVSTGLQNNVTEEMTSSLGNSGSASAQIVIREAGTPVFTKTFAAAIIEVNQVTPLTFTVDNTANGGAATGLAFTDNLPAGIDIATPNNLTNTCGGTPSTGPGTVGLSGGSVAAGATCTLSVDIIGVTTGTHDNTSGDLTSSVGNSGPALASVEVIDNPIPGFSKAFAVSNLLVGNTTTLTFTIDNTSVVADATGLNFTDPLPAGLEVATPANASTTCTGGVLSAASGATSISYSGGTAPFASQCTITVDVVATAAGLQSNTTSDLTSSLGNSGPATAILASSDAGAPVFTKAFATDPLGENETTVLTFTIDNSANPGNAISLDFTDTLPAGLIVATPSNASTTCTGGTVTAVAGTTTISYSGGTVAGNSSCTLTVDVTGTTPGDLTNTSGNLTSSLGNSGPAVASVTVLDAPTFSKQFENDTLSVDGVTALLFTIDHFVGSQDANNLNFTDNLPPGLVLATPANASTNCTGGTLTANDGTTSVSYTGGSISAGSICVIAVDVQATALGAQNNVSGDLTSDLGNSGPAIDNLNVIAGVEWNVAGPDDWFVAGNWLPTIVPNQGLNVGINNGGTSLVPEDSERPSALNLNIGINGGTGTMILEPNSARINIQQAVNIGVTLSGAATSTGLLQFGEDVFGPFNTQEEGPLRIGVSLADGDADGALIYPESFISSASQFTAIQVGVADSNGNAIGQYTGDSNTSGLEAQNGPLQVGVASGSGNATGEMSGSDIEDFSTVDVGVANGSGTANGIINTGFSFEGTPQAINRGPANIGVSNGTGAATGEVNMQLNVFGSITADQFTELNVGIANSTGAASGILRNSNGITIPTINVGLNPGGGTADGRIFVDHGLIRADALTLGAGSTLEFTANASNRATGGGTGTMYSAVNADAATLAGDLIINLNYSPEVATTYEMVNTISPTGITGTFDNVIVNNLPTGSVVTSGVQLDGGGNEQFVVELSAPTLFNWINPNTGPTAGDWFVGANWAPGTVPQAIDPAIVENGGEAVADSGTAPGPIIVRDVIIGRDGNAGLMTSNGVDVEPEFSFLIAKVSPLISAEQTATGTVVINNADITVPDRNAPSTSIFDPGPIIAVGFAQGGGTAQASLEVNNGNLTAGDDIYVGAALPIAIDTTPTSNGNLTFNGGGIGVSTIEVGEFDDLFIAFAQDSNSGPGAQPTAFATANINNATVIADITVASADSFTDDAISQATATSVVLSNLEVSGALDMALSDAFDPRVQTTTSANVTVTDVVFGPDSGTFDIGDADGSDTDATAISTSTSTWTRVTTTDSSSDFEIGFADTSDPRAVATATANVTINQSQFNVQEFEVSQTETQESDGIANSTSTVNIGQNTAISGERFAVAETEAEDTSHAVVNATVNVDNSTIVATEETLIGSLEGDSTNATSTVTAVVNFTGSSLVTGDVNIGQQEASVAGTIDATLSLNPSYVSADNLNLGPDGTLIFAIGGPSRVTLATVGDPNTYAAIDAADALLEGEIIVNFLPGASLFGGRLNLDLIVTDSSTALDDFAANLIVNSIPSDVTFISFGVVEDNGVDLLRLVVDTPVTFVPIPTLSTWALILMITLLALLAYRRKFSH